METANAKAPQNFKDLLVWQRGMALAKWIYEITRTFPSDECFGLVAQMRRAAVSIPSNIAEGQARHTTGEFFSSFLMPKARWPNLETQLRLSVELGFCLEREIQNDFQLMEELRKMLNSLRRKLVTRHHAQ